MVHQIEKNLSNNINENLFSTGRIYDTDRKPSSVKFSFDHSDSDFELAQTTKEYSDEYHENYNQPTLSRAEYIRQAREACLRQMSAAQNFSRPYDSMFQEQETQSVDLFNKKKPKGMRLFHDGDTSEDSFGSDTKVEEENTPQEIAAFRSLIIRIVCAILLFLCVFAVDKLELKVGKFNHTMVEQYVTGNDALQDLENILVTWLK